MFLEVKKKKLLAGSAFSKKEIKSLKRQQYNNLKNIKLLCKQ